MLTADIAGKSIAKVTIALLHVVDACEYGFTYEIFEGIIIFK